MNILWQDLRFGARMLAKKPAFTYVAVVTLALGIGANTAIFSVVDAVLLHRLPYRAPDRLVVVWESNRQRLHGHNVISPADFLDWQDQNKSFEQMAAFVDFRVNLTGRDEPEELPSQYTSVNLFSLLGVNAQIGRTFAPNEGDPGKRNVVILSNGLWQRRFGGDFGLVGTQIKLNGDSYTVIGVMPRDFEFFIKENSNGGKPAQLWLPNTFGANARVRRGRAWQAIARLKPSVTFEQAQAEMDTIASGFEQQYPDFNKGWGVTLVPLQRQLVGDIRIALLMLLAAVGFVLLIACANVANLLLARAATRQKEIAIRTAMGARRGRIVRQLLTESTMLAGLGGAFGLLLASWGMDLLLAIAPKDMVELKSAGLNFRMLGFTLLVSVLTGLIFGLAPALQSARLDLNDTLKEGGRSGSADARGHRIRNLFVVSEVALALVLLIGSGLLIRSFVRLQAVDPGFNPQNLLTVRLLLPGSKYGQDAQRTAFFRQLIQRIEALPGVQSASAIDALPFGALGSATNFTIDGRHAPPPSEQPVVDVRVIDRDYFRAMEIPVLRGRNFTEKEASEASRVVIINDTMARLHFPNEDPVGKRVVIEMKNENLPNEIIGVVGDARYVGLDTEPRGMTYWPHPELARSSMTLVARTAGDPLNLAAAVKSQVLEMDPEQPVADIRTMEQLMAGSVARARFSATLLTWFAVVALILATVGIYGVMSYSVAQRTHEIGVRIALGARAGDVARLVVGKEMTLVAAGIGIGLAASFALTRLFSTLLFNVSAIDPMTFVAVPALLSGVAALACYVPARRATKVDPMVALRYE